MPLDFNQAIKTAERLQVERDQLAAEVEKLTRELAEAREGDWKRLNTVIDPAQPGDYIADAAAATIERLAAIVNRIPKNADGDPVVTGDTHWAVGTDGDIYEIAVCEPGLIVTREYDPCEPKETWDVCANLHSTREAAEAARDGVLSNGPWTAGNQIGITSEATEAARDERDQLAAKVRKLTEELAVLCLAVDSRNKELAALHEHNQRMREDFRNKVSSLTTHEALGQFLGQNSRSTPTEEA